MDTFLIILCTINIMLVILLLAYFNKSIKREEQDRQTIQQLIDKILR